MSATIHKVDFTRNSDYKTAKHALEELCHLLEYVEHPEGFALFVWGKHNAGAVSIVAGESRIAPDLVPAYVHSVATRYMGGMNDI